MDIHKPKPWHGLREFLKEYAIIVVGVMTALAFEQAVEWLHWRHLGHQARADIAADQRRSLRNIGVSDITGPCTARRLQELTDILDKAERDGRLPALAPINPPPFLPWPFRGWDGLVSTQVLAHLEQGESAQYARQVATVNYIIRTRDEDRDTWAVIASMAGPGRPLNGSEAATLRANLGRAAAKDASMRGAAHSLGRDILASGLLTRSEVTMWWKKGADRANLICSSLNEVATNDDFRQLSQPAAPPSQPAEDDASAPE